MGPTNVALVKLFNADQQYADAQRRYDAVSRDVRIQERRVRELAPTLQTAQQALALLQAGARDLELDSKTREEHITKLRSQQTEARTDREYKKFLIEINTQKADKSKIEDRLLEQMETVEKEQARAKELSNQLEAEKARLAETQSKISDSLAAIQADLDRLKPVRDAAAAAVPQKFQVAFERLSERFEGEAMSAIQRPNKRLEEYICSACNMSLVVDIYNRLHLRDEPVACPSCRRFLFIPDELPPEAAINFKKKKPDEIEAAVATVVPAAAPEQAPTAGEPTPAAGDPSPATEPQNQN
jgi:predicted  nucleic acid-binding Zn-ribbon protein